jgi:hypothetical protein
MVSTILWRPLQYLSGSREDAGRKSTCSLTATMSYLLIVSVRMVRHKRFCPSLDFVPLPQLSSERLCSHCGYAVGSQRSRALDGRRMLTKSCVDAIWGGVYALMHPVESRRHVVKTPLFLSEPKAAWASGRLKLAPATLLAMENSSIKALGAADAFAVPRILTKLGLSCPATTVGWLPGSWLGARLVKKS